MGGGRYCVAFDTLLPAPQEYTIISTITTRQPDSETTRALTSALVAGFGGCDCHAHPHTGDVHMCAGHAWLTSDPTNRGLAKTWQRLLFIRTLRHRLLAQEGVDTAPEPAYPTRLPW